MPNLKHKLKDVYLELIRDVSTVLESLDGQLTDNYRLTLIRSADGRYITLSSWGFNSEEMRRYINIRDKLNRDRNLELDLLPQ